MTNLPTHCVSCTLHQSATTWCMRPEVDSRPGKSDAPWVLFVGSAPTRHDDFHGTPFTPQEGRSAGGFLRRFLSHLESRWILDHSVRCWPGVGDDGRDVRPTPKQTATCQKAYLPPLLAKYDPKVIVCLGADAMKAVLGSAAPRSMAAAKSPIRFPGSDRYVVVLPHPVNCLGADFQKWEDLVADYRRGFGFIEEIAAGRYTETQVDYDAIWSADQARAWIRALPPGRLTMDVETVESPRVPDKRTMWHPGAELLCVSFTLAVPGYPTAVFAGDALSAVRDAIRGREVWGHNLKFDAQALWRFLGVDFWEEASSWGDTLLAFYLRDQSLIGNGLKALSMKHLGVTDWSTAVWTAVREQGPTATLKDVPAGAVHQYNATDTVNTARLLCEIIDAWSETERCDPLIWMWSMRVMRLLAHVERCGIPMSQTWIETLRDLHGERQAKLYEYLTQYPEVRAVEEASGKALTPHGKKAFNLLVDAAFASGEDLSWLPRTQVGWRGRKEDLSRLAGISPPVPEAQMTRWHRLWRAYAELRQSYDMQHKRLEGLLEYLQPSGRVHAIFHMARSDSSEGTGGDDIHGGAATGRLISAKPNIQNLGKDKVTRACIQPPPGFLLLEVDYKSCDPVMIAHMSNCVLLRTIFERNIDLYRCNAVMARPAKGADGTPFPDGPNEIPWELPDDELRAWLEAQVDKETRNKWKPNTLAPLYGEEPDTLAMRGGFPIDSVRAWYTRHDEVYPEIQRWYASLIATVESGAKLTNLWGRRRSYVLPQDRNKILNFNPQSMTTDIMAWKAADVLDWILANGLYPVVEIVNLVHDAAWFVIREDRLDLIPEITARMEDLSSLPFEFTVPLRTEVKVGKDGGAMAEWKPTAVPVS